jgi:hypothetical protein
VVSGALAAGGGFVYAGSGGTVYNLEGITAAKVLSETQTSVNLDGEYANMHIGNLRYDSGVGIVYGFACSRSGFSYFTLPANDFTLAAASVSKVSKYSLWGTTETFSTCDGMLAGDTVFLYASELLIDDFNMRDLIWEMDPSGCAAGLHPLTVSEPRKRSLPVCTRSVGRLVYT